jgi:Flp pilus assembly protein TadB
VSTTEQRGLVAIAHTCTRHGPGSKKPLVFTNHIVLRAAERRPPSLCKPGLTSRRSIHMLYTIAVILLIAWLLGIVGTYTIGAFVHVLLVVAVVLFLVGLLSGRRTLV